MLILVSLERFIGPLWLVKGTNGDVTGARSRKSTINGTTGDTVSINWFLYAAKDGGWLKKSGHVLISRNTDRCGTVHTICRGIL
nr:unnamed protein product [Haemonchus contortus]